jgi:hypothetical protein
MKTKKTNEFELDEDVGDGYDYENSYDDFEGY